MIPGYNIEITKVNTSDSKAIEKAIRPNTKLVYIETPCNPLLRLTDIQAVAAIARTAGAKLAVDSTFATPAATKPLQLGADFVIHSLTKYIGGHVNAHLGGRNGTGKNSIRHRQNACPGNTDTNHRGNQPILIGYKIDGNKADSATDQRNGMSHLAIGFGCYPGQRQCKKHVCSMHQDTHPSGF